MEVKDTAHKKGWISEQLCVQAAATCNLYCAYCQNPPQGETDPLGPVIAAIKRRRIKAVSLEGRGEPTTNPRFFEVIRELRAAGVEHFMLSTNAVALSDRAFCKKAVSEIDHFTVNFPSHLPEAYAKATRSVKFRMALAGLKNLKACGAEDRIRLFHIVSAFNFRALPDFAAWTAKNFAGAALANLTFVRNAGRTGDSAAIVPRYSQVSPFMKIALAKLKLAGIKSVAQNIPLCQLAGFEGFSFEFHRWKRGDKVLEDGIAAAARCAACSKCALKPACCGARADYARVHGLSELRSSPVSPAAISPERF